jgi:hypothetical protein
VRPYACRSRFEQAIFQRPRELLGGRARGHEHERVAGGGRIEGARDVDKM